MRATPHTRAIQIIWFMYVFRDPSPPRCAHHQSGGRIMPTTDAARIEREAVQWLGIRRQRFSRVLGRTDKHPHNAVRSDAVLLALEGASRQSRVLRQRRHVAKCTIAIEAKSMVAAVQGVIFDESQAHRRAAMRASIACDDDVIVLVTSTVHDERLTEDVACIRS